MAKLDGMASGGENTYRVLETVRSSSFIIVYMSLKAGSRLGFILIVGILFAPIPDPLTLPRTAIET
jgi:hypothetical protein